MADEKSFLDIPGLTHLWGELKKKFSLNTHTHYNATQSADGMQSAADKKKLDGIEAGANKTVIDTELSDSSTNTVQNKVVKAALDGKAPTQFVMTLTYGSDSNSHTIDKTFAELEAAIQAGSQVRLVDTSGMEYELLAFASGYMAYFAHQLHSSRTIVGFRTNGTVTSSSEVPYSSNNKPTPTDIGAAPAYTYGTEDLTAGTSPLETGKLYFVYE